MDPRSDKNIATLNPETQEKARAFMERCKDAMLPYTVKIVSGTRTYDEQNILYAFSRTRPGRWKTDARGGESWHNFAMAFDIAVFNNLGQYIDEMVEMNLFKRSDMDSIYMSAGEIGESVGLQWGGRWTGKKCDPPHFQYNPQHFSMNDVRKEFELTHKIS